MGEIFFEQTELATAVFQLARTFQSLSDADCGQPYCWRKHDEGLRFAILGTVQELRELAINMTQERVKLNRTVTAVQHLLAQNHSGYRDLQAIFLGVTDEEYDQEPAPGEWSLRYVFGHIVGAERWFFTLALTGLQHKQAGTPPPPLADDAPDSLVGPSAEFSVLREEGSLANMQAYYHDLHGRSWEAFTHISAEELAAPSPLWWEEETYPIEYRLHRCDAHLRQHLIQAEKTCEQIGKPQTEATRLVRLLLNALAEVEGLTIGAAEACQAEQIALAQIIRQRAADVPAVTDHAHQLERAVKNGDLNDVQTLLFNNPTLVNATDQDGLSLVLTATYHQQPAIAQAFVEAGVHLNIFSAAATGNLDRVQEIVAGWDDWLNEYGRDGFTPLQLACFFGHEAVALWLIEKGADVNAVAQNSFKISPIHAATANGNMNVLKALLENRADINAQQQGGFTPLHEAARANNLEMIQLFLENGADPTISNDEGKTALAQAIANGNQEAARFLEEVA